MSFCLDHGGHYISIPEESVKKISDDLGFSEVSNFNRFFKTQINSTPVEFRKSIFSKIKEK